MPTLTLTTELEAVNVMLATIGDTPVNTLVNTGLLNVEQAVATLNEQSRAVQAEGWHFNSEVNYPIVPDVNQNILVPSNVLKIDTTKEFWDYDLVMRGSKMYDRREHTDLFNKTLKFDVVFFLAYEDLPETARHYIKIKAARVYQSRMLGSSTLNGFTQQEEIEVRAKMYDEDLENADNNMLTGSYSVSSVLDRNL